MWKPPAGTTPVFVGSYAAVDAPGIHVLLLDDRGRLRPVGSITGIANPSFVALHPDGTHLYAVSETGLETDGERGAVVSYRLDAGAAGRAAPTMTGRQSTGGDHPCHLLVHPSGDWLVASNYGSGSFAVLPIGTDGGVLEQVAGAGHGGSGHHPGRQDAPHVHSSIFAPGGRHLLVADLGIDRVVVYRFDATTGYVEHIHELDTGPGTGPRHMAFHPDGRHVFVVNELSNSVAVVRYEPASATLELVDVASTVSIGSEANLAADIAVTSDGGTVFVSNRGQDSIATFSFGIDGRLVPVEVTAAGGLGPRGLGLAEASGRLVVANQRSSEVVVLDLKGTTIGGVTDRFPVREPSCAVIA